MRPHLVANATSFPISFNVYFKTSSACQFGSFQKVKRAFCYYKNCFAIFERRSRRKLNVSSLRETKAGSLASTYVHPDRIELSSPVPQTDTLSVELRVHVIAIINFLKTIKFAILSVFQKLLAYARRIRMTILFELQ